MERVASLFNFDWCTAAGGMPLRLDDHNMEFHAPQVVQLSTDVMDGSPEPPVHMLTQQDALEEAMNATAGFTGTSSGSASPGHSSRCAYAKDADVKASESCSSLLPPFTPREADVRSSLRLPWLRRYPVPPGCTELDDEEKRRSQLLRIYQEFVLDLHKGMHMTQLTPNQEYSSIHCQIVEDLRTLQVNQGSGCIIEFPLRAVSKVYRIVKCEDKWYSAGPQSMPPLPPSRTEHIVVVEFMKRKLAFVFTTISAATSFLTCMELLIYRAQESGDEDSSNKRPPRGKAKDISPMFSRFPPTEAAQKGAADRSTRYAETLDDALCEGGRGVGLHCQGGV